MKRAYEGSGEAGREEEETDYCFHRDRGQEGRRGG